MQADLWVDLHRIDEDGLALANVRHARPGVAPGGCTACRRGCRRGGLWSQRAHGSGGDASPPPRWSWLEGQLPDPRVLIPVGAVDAVGASA